ncbi:MAG: PaaI family thioesterase [Candidatus Hodarchaeota archaeon]
MSKTFPLNIKGFHPFGDLIGLNFTKFEKGYSQCVLEVNEKLFNPHKVLHGGVLYSMADTGMGAALYLHLEKQQLCATVEIKINYFKSVQSGSVICDTKVIHVGRKIATLESEILKNNQLVAKAIGTYSIFKIKNKS